jgi:PAS domain S-box-containing protein
MPGVEFQLSEEVVSSTLEDAKSVASSNRKKQEKATRYQSIIDATADGILAMDERGRITTINKAAKKLLKIRDESSEGHPVARYLPSLKRVLSTETPESNKLEKIGGELYVTSHIPIVSEGRAVGTVSTFRDVKNVIRAENEVRRSFSKGLAAKYFIGDFVFSSSLIQDVIQKVRRFAASDSTVLITGETGTGKEILAHSIHNLSQRRKGPFVSINCAALPDQLLESELFGHEEGAFTGSKRGGKSGLFELAHGGSLFLDEIVAAPLSVQSRLLRVLQEKEVMRVGGDRLIPINVRIIAAANKNMQKEVLAGRLREDLFFRLNILNIYIPPLRERIADLPVLVNALMRRMSQKYNVPTFSIPYSYTLLLMDYPWPGNVRQLETFLERLLLLSDNRFDQHVFQKLLQELTSSPDSPDPQHRAPAVESTASYSNPENENQIKIIREALRNSEYCRTKAAQLLGISRTTLWRKMKQLDLL